MSIAGAFKQFLRECKRPRTPSRLGGAANKGLGKHSGQMIWKFFGLIAYIQLSNITLLNFRVWVSSVELYNRGHNWLNLEVPPAFELRRLLRPRNSIEFV